MAPKLAFAYPSFIGYGYSSCIACHYNPIGGGPLNDYGRALGASVISAKPPFGKHNTDDDLVEQSGFLGKTKLPSWLRPAAAFREMILETDIQNHPQPRYITMQAEGSLTIPLMDGKLTFSGTTGYIPPPDIPTPGVTPTTFISREHYVSYRFSDLVSVYAGMLDPAFGIHAPDHEAYFRSFTLLDQSDQTHSVLINIENEKFQVAIQPFLGNLYQAPDTRQKGVTVMSEVEVAENSRVGLSALASTGTYRTHQMGAVHTRLGISEGNSVLAEFGMQRFGFPQLGMQQNSEFLFVQTTTLLTRGFSVLGTLESYVPDLTASTRVWTAGPSLDYFPFQRLEFRLDFLATETLGQNYNLDVYTLLLQGHIWL